jgi:hypothetical protein
MITRLEMCYEAEELKNLFRMELEIPPNGSTLLLCRELRWDMKNDRERKCPFIRCKC